MTEEVKEYTTKAEMNADKRLQVARGFSEIHTDFITTGSKKFRVTYDDTPDDANYVEFFKKKALRTKLKNDTFTPADIIEYLKLHEE